MKRTLIVVAALSVLSACAPKVPPTYTPATTRAYYADQVEQLLVGLSQSAINLNGQGRLSNADTLVAKNIVLTADAGLRAYVGGSSPAQVATAILAAYPAESPALTAVRSALLTYSNATSGSALPAVLSAITAAEASFSASGNAALAASLSLVTNALTAAVAAGA